MQKILTIVRWEYFTRIRSKWFIISTVVFPVIVVISMILPSVLMTSEESEYKIVGLIDETRLLAEQLESQLGAEYRLKDGSPKYQVIVFKDTDTERAKSQAAALLDSSIINSYLVIPADVWDSSRVYYYARNIGNFRDQSELDRTVSRLIRSYKMQNAGLSSHLIKQVLSPIDFKVMQVTTGGKEKEGSEYLGYLMPIIFVLMLFFSIFTSAQILMRSVLTERSNRLVEILLSSVSPTELMSGKIIGLGLLGLTQLLIYLFLAYFVSSYKGLELFNLTTTAIFLIYFVLGYLVYAAIFATLGAIFDNEQDAQSAVSIFSLITILPLILASYVISHPQSLTTIILSFIPIMTPFFMILRLGIFMPPLWELLGTMGILLISVWLLMLAAGKVFRVAILIWGKRPTLPEIWQWVRSS